MGRATKIKFSNLHLVIFVLMSTVLFLNFVQNDYDYTFKSKKCVVSYSFALSNDSTYMVGRVTDKKTQNPVIGINIMVKHSRIGTVPNVKTSEFKIYLPEQNGIILFDKATYTKFEMNYQITSKTLMDHLKEKDRNQEYSHH